MNDKEKKRLQINLRLDEVTAAMLESISKNKNKSEVIRNLIEQEYLKQERKKK